MTRRPGDNKPDPPGGRAAERLREFVEQRYPEGLREQGRPLPETADQQTEKKGTETEEGHGTKRKGERPAHQ